MNTKVLRAATLSLLALSMATGCTISARGAENVPVVEQSPIISTSADVVPENYPPPERSAILGGHELLIEPTETRLIPDDFGLPLIYAMSDGLLIQFYSSSTCPVGVSLEIDHFGTTALGTEPAIRSDEFLKVVVNQNYAMELDPQLMACSADLSTQTYRIFTLPDEDSDSLPVIDWQSVAEFARWSYIHDPENEGGMEREWGPFTMSTGLSN